MNEIRDLAEFTAESLAPTLPEVCQVNPNVYGAELAYWLGTALAKRGIVTSYPQAEDWGWTLTFTSADGAEFALHCGNVDGSRDRWFLQLRRFGRKLFGRGKPSYNEALPLIGSLEGLLRGSPEVSSLEWLYAGDDAAG